ncbi:MAG: DUF4296 domain-containing protein [Bacteroidales bacterium]|nr:DUF4296 domain-containing protein [Bacteroidales bacterium]
MRRSRAWMLLLLPAVLLCVAGCGHRARVIPAKKLVKIYSEMFLTDQWLRDNVEARKMADTTLFFDPIFHRYGYTFEDYDKSVNYYLDRPEKYSKILSKVADQLQAESDRMKKELESERLREEELDQFRKLYQPKDFSTDSLRWSGPETLWPVPDTLGVADTLAVTDSLAVRDSLGRKDSLVGPNPFVKRDSLAVPGKPGLRVPDKPRRPLRLPREEVREPEENDVK